MIAGHLRERISLESIQGPGDGAWAAFPAVPDVFAAVDWLGAGAARVRIRYRGDLKATRDIGRGLRVLYADHVLEVLEIIETDRRKEVHLTCQDHIVATETLSTGAHGVKGESA